MAKAPAAPAEPEQPPAPAPKKGTPWLAIAIAVVIAIMVSVGGSFFLMRSLIQDARPAAAGENAEADAADEEPKPKLPPNYVPLDPAFVVNLDAPGESRFLQVQVQLMTREPKNTDVIKLHEPQIRNALLLLFSQQKPEDVASRAGVEKLQAAALGEVQKILTAETGEPGVDALYFTSFVAQ